MIVTPRKEISVYVTGLGVVSGIGIGVEENITSLRTSQHGMGKITLFPSLLDVPVSEVKRTNNELKQLLGIPDRQTVSRTALLGLLAAQEAIRDAGLSAGSQRTGLISSTSVGGMDLSEQFYPAFRADERKGRLRELVWHDCGASTQWMAQQLRIKDFVTTLSTACSSAANAIMLGARLIRSGRLDAVVVGGTDALCHFTLNGFNSLMILDKKHCRPFDESRAGLNLGEGAGYLVLQSKESFDRSPSLIGNSSSPYCLLSGYANANEAYHQTGSSPNGDGPYLSMSQAIALSGIPAEDIDYINVHGTGTPSNDASESQALCRLFGKQVPAFSSVKPFIGHTLGASEGIEAVYSVLSVRHGFVYPNLNFSTPIAETQLVPETNFQEARPIRHVLSNSFGFGGNDSTLLFSSLPFARKQTRHPSSI